MSAETFIDLILHVGFTYLAGYIVFKRWHERSSAFWGAFIGGILIDLDHLIDYVLTFGPTFDLATFFQGQQFLAANKVYIFFHAWEYVVLVLIATWILKDRVNTRSLLLALCISMLFHLTIDAVLTENRFAAYSILYRAALNFELHRLW